MLTRYQFCGIFVVGMINMKIGDRIRKFRKEKRLTLVELSKLSKVAVATISRMENNIMTGTIDAYASISKGLGMSLSEFFEGLDTETNRVAIKESTEVAVSNSNYSILSLSNNPAGKMKPFLIHIKPKLALPVQKSKADSEKFIYVLTGSIILKLADKNYSLKKSNSVQFKSSVKHIISNPTNKETTIIVVES